MSPLWTARYRLRVGFSELSQAESSDNSNIMGKIFFSILFIILWMVKRASVTLQGISDAVHANLVA